MGVTGEGGEAVTVGGMGQVVRSSRSVCGGITVMLPKTGTNRDTCKERSTSVLQGRGVKSHIHVQCVMFEQIPIFTSVLGILCIMENQNVSFTPLN